ncbi:hypothetical protein NDU88_001333 [Pleurodeles waltl]|uniref:Uncharacterized protein n=1 Tax=Pleurodeles waltl TaxID=8319 RepID=A0AAV7VB34_PLEWA|nr:hypothetical protein NDU88_001333 [Pleurodeles waltl]
MERCGCVPQAWQWRPREDRPERAKKQESNQGAAADGEDISSGEPREEDATPIMKAFMEHLCRVLQEDLATTVKELKSEVAELGQRIDTVERTCDTQEEELDHHRQENLTLQESNQELQYRLEDLENRLWCSNIRIMGVLAQMATGPWRTL